MSEALELFAPLARARKMTIATALKLHVVLPVDRDAFRQVLLNLLDNAVKYGPPGQTITVGSEVAGDSARIWVEERGTGDSERGSASCLGAVRPAQPRGRVGDGR